MQLIRHFPAAPLEALSAHIQRPLLMHPVVAEALTYRWPTGIGHIQRKAGYSPRHFIALFRAAVGLTPKHYFRVQRFNEVLRRLAAQPSAELADVAASIGYSDQAHLTREFRELAGVTPKRYVPGESGSPMHHRALDLRVPASEVKKSSRRLLRRAHTIGLPMQRRPA